MRQIGIRLTLSLAASLLTTSLLATSLLATAASAQGSGSSGGSEGLSPTLSAIKAAHLVRLGYRESSPPFLVSRPGQPADRLQPRALRGGGR